MYNIIQEFNKTNSTNDKREVCKKYKDNVQFIEVFQKAYDKVKWTWGITLKNIQPYKSTNNLGLNYAIIEIEKLHKRELTGNDANIFLHKLLSNLSSEDAYVIERIIDRNLKISFGKTEFNKLVSKENQCVKPPYKRCEIGTAKNIKDNMNFNKKVYSQKKEDGTFRSALVDGENITIMSRPGFEDSFPIIEENLKSLNVDGYVFVGEMTLRGEKDRKKGNGLINSDNPPHEDIVYTIWEMIPIHEYSMTKDEIKKATKAGTMSRYEDTFEKLQKLLLDANLSNVELIESIEIKSMKEAYEHFQRVTKDGFEGTVIKSGEMTHKDGNSKQQLKCKLIIELDMRITSFNVGNKGSSNEKWFSGINFENDEGTIKGTVGITTLTDDLKEWFNTHRHEVTGQVMTLHCNDITQASGNDFFALSHPRYQELRGTEKVTDTLVRSQEQKQTAMELK
jgi:DNA ligase-1